jgi:nucleoid-associated protein YgaU
MDLEIRTPQPYDLVGGDAVGRERVPVAFIFYGSGTSLFVRVRDANGTELAHQLAHAAGSGELGGPFAFEIALPAVPSTKYGTVEFSATASTPPEQVVPVVFGSFVMPGYFTYKRYQVQPGDSLFAIAEAEYKVGNEWTYIYEANSHQIADPNLIFAGQELNIPHSTTTIFHR